VTRAAVAVTRHLEVNTGTGVVHGPAGRACPTPLTGALPEFNSRQVSSGLRRSGNFPNQRRINA
jgi:hypothetical protein